jgi:hypothetical protein
MTDEQIREWLDKLDKRYSWRGWWDLRAEVITAEVLIDVRPFPWSWPVLADDAPPALKELL